jgi:hypothetical protein
MQYPLWMSQKFSSKKRYPRQVSEVLNTQNPGLGKLLKQARQIQFIDGKLAGLLDPGMSANVQAAAVHDNCLILVTPSAALATRLRMDSDVLLQSLEAAGVKGISQLKIRTAPLSRIKKVERKRRKLPEIARLSDSPKTQPKPPPQNPTRKVNTLWLKGSLPRNNNSIQSSKVENCLPFYDPRRFSTFLPKLFPVQRLRKRHPALSFSLADCVFNRKTYRND